MILKDILNGVSGTLLQGDLQQEINSITIDSRKTESNVLFVAIIEVRIPSNLPIREMYAKFHTFSCFIMNFSENIPIPFIIPCIGIFVTSSS